MIESADVIVIGSGGLGAAAAFHMAKRGALQVVLVERLEIGSQTSPRAAGMVSCLRKSDLMIDLIKLAADRIKRFSEDTDQPLDWVQSGSLKVARRPVDVEVIQEDILRARRHGLDVEEISVDAAHRLNPFLQTSGVAAVARIGDDMYFNPAQLAVGFARAAQANGAMLLPNTGVRRVLIEHGEVVGVDTTSGRIRAQVVVDAAGAWTRQVAEACGIRVPLVTTAQQLFVTEPVPGARADLPMVRIMDAAVYMRPCDGGLLWGVYEENPRFFDMNGFDADFDIKDLSLDAEILWHYARDVEAQLPILLKANVREHRGGLPTMTADGQHIVGPAPTVRGFYFASGLQCCGTLHRPGTGGNARRVDHRRCTSYRSSCSIDRQILDRPMAGRRVDQAGRVAVPSFLRCKMTKLRPATSGCKTVSQWQVPCASAVPIPWTALFRLFRGTKCFSFPQSGAPPNSLMAAHDANRYR